MNITDKYKVETDGDKNYILLEKYIKKDETSAHKIVGYYFNLEGAMRGLLKREVLQSEMKDLETVMERIAKAEELIVKLCES